MPAELSELRAAASSANAADHQVSGWSVGMHVHHCCLTMIGVCGLLLDSEPPPPASTFSLLTTIIFLSGRIPRGRAQAPEQVLPRSDISTRELIVLLDESQRLLASARSARADSWFRHFRFGVLNRDQTLKFIGIHNGHHSRIISDILASDQAGR
jgi:hypothetical protein